MRFARGRLLDVGAGAGRVSLHLQERGHEVVAIDNSPGAVEVCRRRGVRDARLLDFAEVDESLGVFDTIVLLGNNFGVFGSGPKAKRLLRPLYRRRNVERGRLPGQIRIRVRFRTIVGPWFDYPMVSPAEMRDILDGTKWRLAQTIDSDDSYVAVIEKEPLNSAARGRAARTAKGAKAGVATSPSSGRRRPRSVRASSRA
jgi:SAM-dependent methyltransferase